MEEAGGSSPFLFTHSCSPPRPIWIHWRTTGLFARALSQAVFTAVLHGRPVCGLKLSMEKRDKCIPWNLFSLHLPELHRLPGISCHEPLGPGRDRITEDWLCRATGTPRRSCRIAHCKPDFACRSSQLLWYSELYEKSLRQRGSCVHPRALRLCAWRGMVRIT